MAEDPRFKGDVAAAERYRHNQARRRSKWCSGLSSRGGITDGRKAFDEQQTIRWASGEPTAKVGALCLTGMNAERNSVLDLQHHQYQNCRCECRSASDDGGCHEPIPLMVVSALGLTALSAAAVGAAQSYWSRQCAGSCLVASTASAWSPAAPRSEPKIFSAPSVAYRAENCAGGYVCDEQGAWVTIQIYQ